MSVLPGPLSHHGSGKTVILAEAVSHIAAEMPSSTGHRAAFKARCRRRQSFANLAEGGKYHHLLAT